MQVKEVMTKNPMTLPATSTVAEAAKVMRDRDIGNVLVEDDGSICGVVTDRDIVVRAIADGGDPSQTKLGRICSRSLTTVKSSDNVDDAVKIMRDKAIRRIPVVDNGKAVGIVAIGDLAKRRDPHSALGHISAASPNH